MYLKRKIDFRAKNAYERIIFFVKAFSWHFNTELSKKTVLKSVQKWPRKWQFLI